VCGDRKGDEERLEREGLVVGACEEEIWLRGGERARYEGDEGSVC
jgi:hypothetical protein